MNFIRYNSLLIRYLITGLIYLKLNSKNTFKYLDI